MSRTHVSALVVVALAAVAASANATPSSPLPAAALAVSTALSATGGAAPPPLVGVVASGKVWTLRPLDPRTLAPLPRGWSRRLDRGTRLVRSPLGGGVAAVGPRITRYLDSRTGAPLRPATVGLQGAAPVAYTDLYWLGGESFGRRGATVVAGIEEVSSGPDAGWYYSHYALNRPSDTAPGIGQPACGLDGAAWSVFPGGLVGTDGDALVLSPPTEDGRNKILLKSATLEAPGLTLDVAADIPGDRLFVISAGGTIAEIDHLSSRPHVTYHHLDLNGGDFQSAWAGHGKIALWGQNGLSTIDTRTWTTQPLDGRVRSGLVTPYGIVAWTYDASSPSGLWIFPLDGRPPYSVLEGKIVPSPSRTHSFAPTAVGRYLYFNLTGGHRYTLDLAAGRLIGANTHVVNLALPSYVPIR